MNFLESQKTYDATVLEIPGKQIQATEEGLVSWYKGTSPAIIAFGNKRSYLNFEYMNFPGVDIGPRINFLQKILLCNNAAEIESELLEKKIAFIYSPYPLSCFEGTENIAQVYQNQGITIYQVYEN